MGPLGSINMTFFDVHFPTGFKRKDYYLHGVFIAHRGDKPSKLGGAIDFDKTNLFTRYWAMDLNERARERHLHDNHI